ncbi:sulfite reductase [NADPH] flavoprotein component [Zygosaccharomyces mellis]|uniref:assimilatory sulfite reductase (NADPH) n=1 Tax=Zygosaccharomyces mellis TaxID=42258 RepID=A0A4C2E3W9_9SACH|nr:sulfite reductase [NADPH] flavoprotein component [Zygosaccharomyces mellis]
MSYAINPFGLPTDPKRLPPFTTPASAISSVLYNNLKTIFSYKTFSDADLLDASLKKWIGKASNDVFFQELDVRSGAGLSPLGFTQDTNETVGIITPGYSLPYFVGAFQSAHRTAKFLFNVGALSYDESSSSIGNDYVTPLNASRQLGFPVVTPVSSNEVQIVALLATALAHYGPAGGALNLFDGVNYSRTISQIREQLGQEEILPKLAKVLPSNPSFNEILNCFNDLTGSKLQNFEYSGSKDAETVFVTYGSLESQLFDDALNSNDQKIGRLAVRVPLPFNAEKFVTQLPKTTKKIVVISQSLDGTSPTILKSHVAASLFYQARRGVSVSEYIYQPTFIWSPYAVDQIIGSFVLGFQRREQFSADRFLYWAGDKSSNIDLASRLVHALSLVDGQTISFRSKFDNVTNAGVFQAQFTTASKSEIMTVSNLDSVQLAFVENIAIIDGLDVVATVDNNGTIILISRKSLKDQDLTKGETYVKTLGINEAFFRAAHAKNIKVVIIDAASVGDKEETKGRTLSFVSQATFWKYAYGFETAESVRRVWASAGSDTELLASVLSDTISNAFDESIKEVPTEAFEDIIKDSKEQRERGSIDGNEGLPIFVTETSFTPNSTTIEDAPIVESNSVSEIAKQLSFREAYGVKADLRPDQSTKNYVVRVKENKRVTPEDYDRYIFHIEFDISGTGMTYDIGEALGVHGRNDETLVKEFLGYYGLNANEIIHVPSKDNTNVWESRTVLQAFIENLDIFGKPPKRFYESLIKYATDADEKRQLAELVTAVGAVALKNFQEVEFYTYADILKLFPSARPKLVELVELIAPLKRREYSIASSQKVHPNEIHLLIVVVDWTDNKGRKRFGQASKYLADLPVGSELVVSVKPSVMKLPPMPQQPVIMSGLGTGLAPFKAIVEEKYWQKQQGYDIGEVYLFLGSRHKRQEYLYGEIWEAYKDAGIITHIGAAFSRDQPKKIYIQDRILESLKDLKTAMIDKVGSFYLCGPTWPVPDITNSLQKIIDADAQERGVKVDLGAAIENLKEDSRYILEVY